MPCYQQHAKYFFVLGWLHDVCWRLGDYNSQKFLLENSWIAKILILKARELPPWQKSNNLWIYMVLFDTLIVLCIVNDTPTFSLQERINYSSLFNKVLVT